MKIIHAIFSFHVGGAETMLVDIINQQCKEASVVLIVVNSKINADLLSTIDERVSVFLLNREESSKFQLPAVFLQINRIVNTINPDVIHCHDNKLFPFFFRWKRKTCMTVHSVNLSTRFLKHYRKIFAISAAVQQNIKKLTGIDARIVHNGIEIIQYQSRLNYDYDPEKDEFKIIQISRLFPIQKGQQVAIKAMSLLKEQNPNLNIKMYFIGEGEALKELEEMTFKHNVQDRIVFKGVVNREWIKNNLHNYNVLIQPSLIEGFGITIIEGFACGLPVIASNLDGPREIIETLHSGLLVKPNDPADLADKINQVFHTYVNKTIDNKYIVSDDIFKFDISTTVKNYNKLYPTG
jgi:glycosyltransferase involved in cell wall biosynthesis